MAAAFSASFLLVAPLWALMLFAPGWHATRRLLGSPAVAAPAALAYAVAVAPVAGRVLAAVSPPDLAAVSALLGTPAGAMVAWAHFLAFDLFVARWIYLDSRARSIPHHVLAPTLLVTLMLGPVGYLAHLGARSLHSSRTPEMMTGR